MYGAGDDSDTATPTVWLLTDWLVQITTLTEKRGKHTLDPILMFLRSVMDAYAQNPTDIHQCRIKVGIVVSLSTESHVPNDHRRVLCTCLGWWPIACVAVRHIGLSLSLFCTLMSFRTCRARMHRCV